MQGFPRARSEKALILTHNCGLEPAINWMVEHADDADVDAPLARQPSAPLYLAQPALPVVGFPANAPTVVHPDGGSAPAHVVGVQGETKAGLVFSCLGCS